MSSVIERELAGIVGSGALGDARDPRYATDATESQGLFGVPGAVVLPESVQAVASVVRWCCDRDVPVIPRGGGTGFAGGCVPRADGVVIDTSRLREIRSFDPELWRIHVGAGLCTAEVHRLARSNGLLFPPDPGASEQSQIGGNIATNAGGPHAFKYGATGAWVNGVEAVVPPGEVVRFGGPVRKDVAGYDLRGLLVGSEGTLGIITAAWLRLVPAPVAAVPVVAAYPSADAGCEAVRQLVGSGVQAAAVEYLDRAALAASAMSFPWPLPADAGFLVIAEADGDADGCRAVAEELAEVLGEGATALLRAEDRSEIAALWRWREGVSGAVQALHGGKVSEDIAVPVDRLLEAVEATAAIGERFGLDTCSWGHAGDGNLHSTFLVDPASPDQIGRAHEAASSLYEAAVGLGGSISGEHGLGVVKSASLGMQWGAEELRLHAAVKAAFDPAGVMNPGVKGTGSRFH